MEEVKEFLTKDLGLAVSLMADNVKYLRVDSETNDDPRARKRLIFVFEYNDDIQRIQAQRANDTHVVSSTRYEDCQRRLKSIIHSV